MTYEERQEQIAVEECFYRTCTVVENSVVRSIGQLFLKGGINQVKAIVGRR